MKIVGIISAKVIAIVLLVFMNYCSWIGFLAVLSPHIGVGFAILIALTIIIINDTALIALCCIVYIAADLNKIISPLTQVGSGFISSLVGRH